MIFVDTKKFKAAFKAEIEDFLASNFFMGESPLNKSEVGMLAEAVVARLEREMEPKTAFGRRLRDIFINSHDCPHCGSDDIHAAGGLEGDDIIPPFSVTFHCKACDKRWLAVFEATGGEELKGSARRAQCLRCRDQM